MSVLDDLEATIQSRRGADPEQSWTAKLLSDGKESCAKKFGEEAVEAVWRAWAETQTISFTRPQMSSITCWFFWPRTMSPSMPSFMSLNAGANPQA